MRKWSPEGIPCNFSKFALYDAGLNTGAISETDDWIEGHSGLGGDTIGYNGALNAAMRAALTADMKTDLFLAVAAMRRGIDYIKRLIGEVD